MKRAGIIAGLLVAFTLAESREATAQKQSWEVGLALGATFNIPTNLKIRQTGESDIKMRAKYRTEPFTLPVYYDIRVRTWRNQKAWEVKFTHHKLILKNLPPQVQRFSITDGFNLLTVNRLWTDQGFIYSIGAGVVITHPESTIRGQVFPENRGIFNKGYYLSGPTIEAAVARRYYFHDRWFVFGEGRITGSYVRVPVANGHAYVTNAALHGLGGAGYKITK